MASMNTHIDYFLTFNLKLWTQRSWLSVTRAFSGGDSWAVSWGCTHLKSGWLSCTAVTRGFISLQTQAGISKGLHDCPHSVVVSPEQEIQEDKPTAVMRSKRHYSKGTTSFSLFYSSGKSLQFFCLSTFSELDFWSNCL